MSRSYALMTLFRCHVDEVLPGRRAPVADDEWLDVRQRQRLAQERVVVEVDLANRQVVGGAPIGIDEMQFARHHRVRASSIVDLSDRVEKFYGLRHVASGSFENAGSF